MQYSVCNKIDWFSYTIQAVEKLPNNQESNKDQNTRNTYNEEDEDFLRQIDENFSNESAEEKRQSRQKFYEMKEEMKTENLVDYLQKKIQEDSDNRKALDSNKNKTCQQCENYKYKILYLSRLLFYTFNQELKKQQADKTQMRPSFCADIEAYYMKFINECSAAGMQCNTADLLKDFITQKKDRQKLINDLNNSAKQIKKNKARENSLSLRIKSHHELVIKMQTQKHFQNKE